MLVAALVVTLVGFALLVVALITSSVAFAWACIVICLIGFGLLIADVLGVRKGGKASAPAAVPTAASAAAGATAVHAASAEPADEGETFDAATETSPFAFDAPIENTDRDESLDEPELEIFEAAENAGVGSAGTGIRAAQAEPEADAAAAEPAATDETVDLTKQDKQ